MAKKKAKVRFGWGWVDVTGRRVKKGMYTSLLRGPVYAWSVSSKAAAHRRCLDDERVVRVEIREV